MTLHLYGLRMAFPVMATVESPRCPSYWRGSGCYDINVYNTLLVVAYVMAQGQEEAERLVSDWARTHTDHTPDCDEWSVISCEELTMEDEDDTEGVIDGSYGYDSNPEWWGSTQEPDLDAVTLSDFDSCWAYDYMVGCYTAGHSLNIFNF